ncbi:putative WD-repeat protein [Mrakia frigida]|uniref:Aip1p n=1 Tax=Mrakia frigida TaxID=29902 RepID=UPI003FCC05B1
MSFTKAGIYPPVPGVTRGRATKLSASSDGSKLVYTNDKTVVLRDLRQLSASTTYTQHNSPATVARLSPSGYYVASADTSGTVRVWDVAGSDQVLKLEMKGCLGGKVNDLAWDAESKRIIAVGEGRESFGRAFLADSGSSCGEILGHNKAINAVSIRSKRPFRAATGGDDGTISLLNGVPYKFSKVIKSHTSFVNDVGFSPDGELLASVGSDGKVFVYDGAEGEIKGELSGGASSGSLYSLAWSPDSQILATSSASSVVQLYSPSTLQPTTTFNLSSSGSSSDPSTQQLGLTFLTPATLASISLSGALNILDTRAPEQVVSLWGPSKGITAVGISEDGDKKKTFWAGSFDGGVKSFKEEQEWEVVGGSGEGHKGQVVGVAGGEEGSVWTAGWDDCVREIKGGEGFSTNSVPTSAQPTDLVSTPGGEFVLVATSEGVDVLSKGKKIASRLFKGEKVLSVAAGKSGSEVVVAVGFESKTIQLFSLGSSIEKFSSDAPVVTFSENKGAVYALNFSPEGDLLAAGDSSGKIQVYDVKEKKIKISSRWASHTGRITSLRFSPSGKHCASSSLDTNVFVWSVEKPLRSIKIANAHSGGAYGVEWLGEKRIASGGADAVVRVFDVVFHA